MPRLSLQRAYVKLESRYTRPVTLSEAIWNQALLLSQCDGCQLIDNLTYQRSEAGFVVAET